MTVKRAKIQIDVEATTEGAVRGFDRLSGATDKSRRAVERNDAAIKKASLEYTIASARAANLADAQKVLTARYDAFTNAVNKSNAAQARQAAASKDGAGGMMSMAGAAARVGGALGVAAVATAAAAMAVSELGGESQQIQGVFKNLPYQLEPARQATRGLADDMTLARLSIMANQSGAATTAAAFGDLAGMAQTLAMKMGRDVNDTIERVTLGIAKQEREILDELVILPRMEQMWADYAVTLGKSTAQLTDHEKTAAFTKSAMDALRSATQGVDVDMDGAAASITKATVAAKNLRTEILAGGLPDETLSLAEGFATLDAKLIRAASQMAVHGANFRDVKDALRAAGVDVSKYGLNYQALEKDIGKAVRTELRQLTAMAERHELTAEQLDDVKRMQAAREMLSDTELRLLGHVERQVNAAQEAKVAQEAAAAAEIVQRNERLLEIEEQLVFGRAAQASQEQLNLLVEEEAALRAEVLELEGKGEEAAEVRRKAQLAKLAADGAMLAPKSRGGGRRQRPEVSDSDKAFYARQAQQFDRWTYFQTLNEARRKQEAETDALYNPFSPENLEQQLANVIDFEAARGELVLTARMREIETLRANGADPVQLAEAAAAAQVEQIAVVERATAARFEREIRLAEQLGQDGTAAQLRAEREIALLELQDQAEAQHHTVALARIEERRAAEEQAHAIRAAMLTESSELVLGAAGAVVEASVIQGAGLKATIATTAKSEAMRHGLILGPSELIRAGISAAGGNIPGAVLHAKNAAKSFAFAGAMAGIAGAAGGFGGASRGAGGGGFGAANFGPGEGAANGPSNRSGSSSSFNIGGSVPLSLDTRRNVSATAAQGGSGAGVVVRQDITISALDINDGAATKIVKAIDAAGRRQGRLVAGGR